jgi:hypothetical protein
MPEPLASLIQFLVDCACQFLGRHSTELSHHRVRNNSFSLGELHGRFSLSGIRVPASLHARNRRWLAWIALRKQACLVKTGVRTATALPCTRRTLRVSNRTPEISGLLRVTVVRGAPQRFVRFELEHTKRQQSGCPSKGGPRGRTQNGPIGVSSTAPHMLF